MSRPVRVAIEGLDADGLAVGTQIDGASPGRVWRLKGAIPGQVVTAGGRPKHGAILGIERDAPDAVAPRCPLVGTCGGCLYQALPLPRQHEEKLRALRRLLAPLGAAGGLAVPPGEGFGYRNKIELSFGIRQWVPRSELGAVQRPGFFLGFHGGGHFDRIVDAPDCHLADPALRAVLARARADLGSSPFPAWDAREKVGFWRHLALRRGENGVLALLYTSPGGPAEADWIRHHAHGWGTSGLLWYESERSGDVAHGTLRAAFGANRLAVRFGDAALDLDPTAFFQVNDSGAALLLDLVREMLGEGDTLLDLYCGVGAFGLALADRFARVGGIELHAGAIAEARANAARLGVAGAWRAGPVESELPALIAELGAPDGRLAVLVDPPRAGLHPRALEGVAALPAEVLVYVACKPSSLARDGRALLARGWRCTGWTAVDLFPHTAHIEVAARFVRA